MAQVSAGPFPRFNRILNRIGNAGATLGTAAFIRNQHLLLRPGFGPRKTFHPLAGANFGKKMARRRGRTNFSRKKGKGRRKGRMIRKRSARVARQSPKKIATEVDLLTHNIEQDLTQPIIGGGTAAHQVWNTITQGVTAAERIGDRTRRTGLWLTIRFVRSLPQQTTNSNYWVRVIFARQRGHSHRFPLLANGDSGEFPVWPKANECFTRDWHREFKLVKDRKIFFGLRAGTAPDAEVTKLVTFKFKWNYPCTFPVGSGDMDQGRLYFYVVCPDTPPATANDLKIKIEQYCNYFVDELG